MTEKQKKESQEKAMIDLNREERKGVPEVVLAESKATEEVLEIVRFFLVNRGRAIVSRVSADLLQALIDDFAHEYDLEHHKTSRMVVIRNKGGKVQSSGGMVGIMTAGT